MNGASSIRPFLMSMTEGAAHHVPVPKSLFALAARVGGGDAAKDLVQELCLDLLERRHQAGSVENLLQLNDKELVRALSKRLYQVRAERHGDRWKLIRALGGHVRAALAPGHEPMVVESWPLSLMEGNRLSGHQVEHAVWYTMSHSDPPNRPGHRSITATLFRHYFGDAERHLFAEVVAAEDALDPDDASHYASSLRQGLGEEQVRVLSLLTRGEPLKAICRSPSSAHDRKRRAVQKARDLVQELGLSFPEMATVLQEVAA